MKKVGIVPSSSLLETENPYHDCSSFIELYTRRITENGGLPLGILNVGGFLSEEALEVWRKTYFPVSLAGHRLCTKKRKKAPRGMPRHAGNTQLFYCEKRAEKPTRKDYFGSLYGNEEGKILLCRACERALEIESESG